MNLPRPPLAADTRGDLLHGALLCFARNGYEATSIREVAAGVGKNPSLIAYYFGSKEGLYRAVLQEYGPSFTGREDRIPLPADPGAAGQAPARRRLRETIARLLTQLDVFSRSRDPARKAAAVLWLNELMAPKAKTRDLLDARMAPLVEEFRMCILEICPCLGGTELDLWGTIIQGSCFGYALMAQMNDLVWSEAAGWSDSALMSEKLSSFIYFGLRNACLVLPCQPCPNPVGVPS